MPTTSPDNLWSPESSDSFEDLVPDLATMQGSVQSALQTRAIRSYKWEDAAARNAQTGMSAGDTGYQIDTDTMYQFRGSRWAPFMGGLNVMTPSSSSGTVSPSGKVTFSGASVIDIDGVFIPEMERYEIHFYFERSTSSRTLARFRSGGIVNDGNFYTTQQLVGNATSVSANRVQTTGFDFITGTSTSPGQGVLRVDGPAQSRPTRTTGEMNWGDGGILQLWGGAFDSPTTFDGIRFYPNTGTISGWVTVYGFYG